ncbi:MAG: hypothetical protein JO118_15135, partial [Acetobacteraceae bacterium]|nr:hypothetical protein [Acetobacteraceae bacterium]
MTQANWPPANPERFKWHTPAQWVEAVRRVLGAIDLDPASSDRAQETVAAATYFTKEMDGLSRPWRGRVWLNPPYAAGVVDRFVGKLVRHVGAGDVTAAILLVDSRTDTQWFHHAAGARARVCFTRGRISFVRPDGAGADAATSGSAFLYFGAISAPAPRPSRPCSPPLAWWCAGPEGPLATAARSELPQSLAGAADLAPLRRRARRTHARAKRERGDARAHARRLSRRSDRHPRNSRLLDAVARRRGAPSSLNRCGRVA